jgi:hypothetical protein
MILRKTQNSENQHYDPQHNDTPYNGAQNTGPQNNAILRLMTISIITLNTKKLYRTDCTDMLSDIMLNAICLISRRHFGGTLKRYLWDEVAVDDVDEVLIGQPLVVSRLLDDVMNTFACSINVIFRCHNPKRSSLQRECLNLL